MRHLFFAALVAAALVPATGGGATYPDRPIRLLVPQGVGASNDTLSRALAIKYGEVIGQQIVVDNRAGAGGLIGMELAAHAAADGYTILASATATQVIAPQLHRKLSFDPFKDLLPVSLFASTANILVTNPAVPAKTVKEFIAFAKAQGPRLNMASAGAGAQSHLAGVQLMLAAGFESTHVPYKGGGASVASVMAGESQWTLTPLPATLSHVQSGRLKAFAVGSTKRTTQLPDVPTIAESGLPGFQSTGWVGLLLPKGTPASIFEKVRATLLTTMQEPETRTLIQRQGGDPVTDTPDEFAKFIRSEWDSFGAAIRAAKLKVE